MYMNTPVTVPFSGMYRHSIWIGTVRFAITSYWHIFVQYLSMTKNWIGSIFQDPFSIQVFVFGKPYRTYRSQSFNIKWWHSQMFYSQNSVCKGGSVIRLVWTIIYGNSFHSWSMAQDCVENTLTGCLPVDAGFTYYNL